METMLQTAYLIIVQHTALRDDNSAVIHVFWEQLFQQLLLPLAQDSPKLLNSLTHMTALRAHQTQVSHTCTPHIYTFVSPPTASSRAVVSYWRKNMTEVLVNRFRGLSLPRKVWLG